MPYNYRITVPRYSEFPKFEFPMAKRVAAKTIAGEIKSYTAEEQHRQ